MKIAKSMALMGIGAGAVLAYQKYSKPVMKKMNNAVDNALDKASKKLEDMK